MSDQGHAARLGEDAGRIVGQRLHHLREFMVQIVFANESGLRRNVGGWRQLWRSRRSHKAVAVTTGKAGELRRRGFVRFDNHLPAELLDTVGAKFAELIADDTRCRNLGVGAAEASRYLVDPNVLIPELAQLLSPEVQAVAAGAYGAPFRVRHIRAYRNTPPAGGQSDSEVFGNFWHLDPEIVCDLRYFVYLTQPTTALQGALETLDRTTSRIILRTGYLGRGRIVGPARRILERRRRNAVQEGIAGTAILIDAQRCLHRAGLPSPGEHRDIVQFWLTPTPEPMRDGWGSTIRDPAWSVAGYRPGDG